MYLLHWSPARNISRVPCGPKWYPGSNFLEVQWVHGGVGMCHVKIIYQSYSHPYWIQLNRLNSVLWRMGLVLIKTLDLCHSQLGMNLQRSSSTCLFHSVIASMHPYSLHLKKWAVVVFGVIDLLSHNVYLLITSDQNSQSRNKYKIFLPCSADVSPKQLQVQACTGHWVILLHPS